MEKTIQIDGKDVKLKSTAATPLRYKAQFGKDFFAELLKLNSLTALDMDNMDYETIKNVDFEVFYNIIWIFAKTADKTIDDPLAWLDGFDEFPIMEIIPEIQDLLIANLQSKKK